MRILIHAANLQKGGALQVAASLLEEFLRRGEHEFHLLAAPPILSILEPWPERRNLTITRVNHSPTAGVGAWRKFLYAARHAETTWKPDAALTVFGPGLWRPRVPHLMGFANGLYLFSNSRFIREDWPVGRIARSRYALRRRLLLLRVRSEADAWWAETTAAKDVLANAANIPAEKISVIPNAPGSWYAPFLEVPSSTPVRPQHGEGFHVLVIGAAYPNKNLPLIAAMLPLLNGVNVCFSFTLPDGDFREIFREYSYDQRLNNLGPLTPDEAPAAYGAADAVMLPSKLETFSAVLLEAAAIQKPLLVSDLPWAREVCGDTALYFDPWDASSAAEALLGLMASASLQQDLAAVGLRRVKSAPTAAFRADRILEELSRLVIQR